MLITWLTSKKLTWTQGCRLTVAEITQSGKWRLTESWGRERSLRPVYTHLVNEIIFHSFPKDRFNFFMKPLRNQRFFQVIGNSRKSFSKLPFGDALPFFSLSPPLHFPFPPCTPPSLCHSPSPLSGKRTLIVLSGEIPHLFFCFFGSFLTFPAF